MRKTVVSLVMILVVLMTSGTLFAESKAMMGTYTGYLMDKACADMGKGMDGSDIVNSPQDHTKKCLVFEPCKQSGYGVWLKGDSGEYEFVKFDAEGDETAWELITNASRKDNFAIEVEGTLEDDVLSVDSLVLK
jgi:hypothetical protein